MSSPPPDQTSVSLLERVRCTDDAASWTKFVDLYAPLVLTWCRRLGVPPSNQDDVVQTVFATLMKKLPEFRYDPTQRFRGFLFEVTRSRVVDAARAAPRPAVGLPDIPIPDPVQAVIDADYNRHVALVVDRVLATDFDSATTAAFRRYVVDGVLPRDVAAELGIAVTSVYQAKTRVLRRLRVEFDGLLD